MLLNICLQLCTRSQFHQHVKCSFLPISFCQKITNTNCKYIKAVQNTFNQKMLFEIVHLIDKNSLSQFSLFVWFAKDVDVFLWRFLPIVLVDITPRTHLIEFGNKTLLHILGSEFCFDCHILQNAVCKILA